VAAKRPPIRPESAHVIETWQVLCPAGKRRFLREWVVDDAVYGEPVCRDSSLLTGKIAGNYLKIAGFIGEAGENHRKFQIIDSNFPTKPSREFIMQSRE
jgi:hypothetical protein